MIIFTKTKNRFKIKNNGSRISIFSKNIIEIKKKSLFEYKRIY